MADSAPSMPKRFWPTYLVAEELLEGLGGVEALEDVALLVGGRGRSSTPSTCSWIQRFSSGSWMCMYSMPMRAAVGVAQDVEDVAERHAVAAPPTRAGEELAVEVPDGEAVGGRVELGVHVRLLGRQRVEVGDEVAADAVGVDERR